MVAFSLRTRPVRRRLRFELLERRQLLSYDLAYSVFPDDAGPQNAGFGTAVAVTDSLLVVGSPLEDFNEVFDGGTVRIYDAGSRALLTTINNPAPASNDRFGAAIAVSGNLVVVGVPNYNTSGKAYLFNATTGALLFTLNNPSPAISDNFGYGVAIDGTTVVVGAPYHDLGTVENIGEVYVFSALTGALLRSIPHPTPTARNANLGQSVAISGDKIVASAPQNGGAFVFSASSGALLRTLASPSSAGNFGSAVAISGNTAVVGAKGYSNLPGAAGIYAADTGALLTTLRAPTPTNLDQFGYSVAVRGSTVVVGAVESEGPSPFATRRDPGSAYVFDAPSGALVTTLNNPEPSQFDFFGSSVGITSDTVLVGAAYGNTGRNKSGRAWLYNQTTAAWGSLVNPTRPAGDGFGAVALSGDLLVVGAAGDDTDAQEMGQVYVYNAVTGALVSTFNKPDPGDLDLFGGRVDISGDYVIASAVFDDTQANAGGRAYVFNARTGQLVTKLLNPSNGSDVFSQDVGISGNLAIVGANQFDDGPADSGIAYVYNAITGALLKTLHNPTPAANEGFGVRTTIEGSLAAVSVSAKSQNGAGEVYLFNALTGALLATLIDPSPNTSNPFGSSIAIQGNLIAVGDPGSAAVHLFDVSGTRLRTILGGSVTNGFGVSVAFAGDRLVVGAFQKTTSVSMTGQAYVYNVNTGQLLQTIDNPTPEAKDYFGISVTASQNLLVVGADGDNTQNINQGAAYGFIDAAPTVTAASFLPQGTLTAGTIALGVTFSEATVGADSAANYRLSSAGADSVLGTADDVSITVTGVVVQGTTATLSVAGLAPGAYRLTVRETITDTSQFALDGDGNRIAGGDWTRDFNVIPMDLQVSTLAASTTGIRFTLSRAAVIADLNLFGTSADVSLIGGTRGAAAGSLIVAPGDTDFTFVITGGTLPPDNYTLTLRSAADGFHTPAGELLDGNGDGTTGDNFTTTFTVVAPPANVVTVSLPHFVRGPEQPVNVPTTSTLGLPINVSDGANLTAMQFDLAYDVGLLTVTNVALVGGGTATLTPLGVGQVRVALTFSTPLSAGPQTVAYVAASVPSAAAIRYGERGILDISNILLTAQGGGSVPGLDQDAVQINTYFGDVGRNGRYDSFDVQQTSRLALDLDTGFQQYPLADPVLLADFNDNGRIDSFDTQRVSRLALNLPVTEAADLPNPLPTVTDTDRVVAEQPPKSPPAAPTQRSDIDGDGSVDAQDVLWAVYYFGESSNGTPPSDIELKRVDVNSDGLFDAADILLTINDLDPNAAQAEGESSPASSKAAAEVAEEDLESLAYLLAVDSVVSKKKLPV